MKAANEQEESRTRRRTLVAEDRHNKSTLIQREKSTISGRTGAGLSGGGSGSSGGEGTREGATNTGCSVETKIIQLIYI